MAKGKARTGDCTSGVLWLGLGLILTSESDSLRKNTGTPRKAAGEHKRMRRKKPKKTQGAGKTTTPRTIASASVRTARATEVKSDLPCLRQDCQCSSRWGDHEYCCRTCAQGTPCTSDVHPHPKNEFRYARIQKEFAEMPPAEDNGPPRTVNPRRIPLPESMDFENWPYALLPASVKQAERQLIVEEREAKTAVRDAREQFQEAKEARQATRRKAASETVRKRGREDTLQVIYAHGQSPTAALHTTHTEVAEVMKEAGEEIPTLMRECLQAVALLLGNNISEADNMQYLVTSAPWLMDKVRGGNHKPPLSGDKDLKGIHPSDWEYHIPF